MEAAKDFRKFRLSDDDNGQWMLDAMDRMGFDKYMKFEDKVFTALEKLKPGKYYEVSDVAEDKQELFVKICCIYIQKHQEVVFSNDYSRVEKEEVYHLTKYRIALKNSNNA